MASPILLSVDTDRISVAPGASVEFAVIVQNLTTLVDQVALRVDGLDPAWVQIVPQFLPVFAQSTARARVIVSPPASFSQSAAGLYSLQLSGKAQENGGAEGQAAAVLEVQPAGDYQLKLGPGRAAGYQETAYPLSVQNGANSPLRLRLSGADKNDALWYKFEPFQLLVPAGSAASVTLTIKSKQPAANRQAIIFSVSAAGDYELREAPALAAPARQLAGQYVQLAPAALMLTLSPTQAEGVAGGVYQLRVGNPGGIPVTVQLSAISDDTALVLRPNPVLLSLGPQAEATARLDVEAGGQQAAGARQTSTFRVRAVTNDGAAQPAEIEGRFVRVAAAPKPFPWLMVALIVLFALFVICGIGLLAAIQGGLFR
jgi:hypothetical protein